MKNITRRNKIYMMMLKGLILLVLALFSSCSEKKERIYRDEITGLFDTVHILVGYDKSEEDFKKKILIYRQEMEKYHRLYTAYENFEGINNIKTINDNAGIKAVKVDKEIIDLLEISIKWRNETGSKVNIFGGEIIALWNGMEETGFPTREKLENAKKCSVMENVEIDRERNTVFLKKKCIKIDIGAVAKGYAVEKTAEKMETGGISSFMISAGGNVRIIGKRPLKNSNVKELERCRTEFCVGVTLPIYYNKELDKNNPYNRKEGYLAKIAAVDTSIVTTGNYQRYSIKDNKLYGHIIDLDKLEPVNNFASVTVMTKDSGFADFMSTTLFLMPYEEGRKLVEKMGNIEVIWAFNDGRTENTGGLKVGDNFVKYSFEK